MIAHRGPIRSPAKPDTGWLGEREREREHRLIDMCQLCHPYSVARPKTRSINWLFLYSVQEKRLQAGSSVFVVVFVIVFDCMSRSSLASGMQTL